MAHTLFSPFSIFFFCFVITESKGMEWASTCEQLQMLQCQHVCPQAVLFAMMEREMDWTMHVLELLVLCGVKKIMT